MATIWRIIVLVWADVVALFAMCVMMQYLTNVWNLGFTHAAAILNIFWGAVIALPLVLEFVVDTMMGNYWMLLISSIAYSIGWGFLAMSTPPVLANAMGTCSEFKPECIGNGQKILFYTAMPLIALGLSGHFTSGDPFVAEQFNEEEEDEDLDSSMHTPLNFNCGTFAVVVVTAVAVIALPYIRPWSIRFGIPAICSVVATLLFFSGSCSYTKLRPQGSPLTMFFRVFVAATAKLFHRIPRDPKKLYEIHDPKVYTLPHKRSLRCLDKAAVVIPTTALEEQEKSRWKLCRVTEVEETKSVVRMIPVWMTFILCGVVSAIGLTYFVEQLSHMNQRVGRLEVSIVVLLWLHEQSRNQFTILYATFANFLNESGRKKYAPSIGIVISMILAILCCITAAKVENRRLGVVQKHGLVDKPDETVPMTMFWMLPQLILLGAFDGVFNYSVISFFVDQFPVSAKSHLPYCIRAVFGVGILGSVLLVFVVGKVSERGGKMNWFQHDLNKSRLDKYYWTLAWLMAINIVIFVVVAIFYHYKESEIENQEPEEFGGIEEPFEDNATCCCC